MEIYVYDSTEGKYDVILGIYILITLGADIELYKNTIVIEEGIYKEWITTIVKLNSCDYEPLNQNNQTTSNEFFKWVGRRKFWDRILVKFS